MHIYVCECIYVCMYMNDFIKTTRWSFNKLCMNTRVHIYIYISTQFIFNIKSLLNKYLKRQIKISYVDMHVYYIYIYIYIYWYIVEYE